MSDFDYDESCRDSWRKLFRAVHAFDEALRIADVSLPMSVHRKLQELTAAKQHVQDRGWFWLTGRKGPPSPHPTTAEPSK